MRDFTTQTQAYSTWGDKLLQHCDRLNEIQLNRCFRPITLQLAPTEVCDDKCSFCSVKNRPKGKIPWLILSKGLRDFAKLGIKAVEITGGGNPMLYRDGDRNINDIVRLASDLKVQVGIITNSAKIHLDDDVLNAVSWIRVSLAKLDTGAKAGDYDLDTIPMGKLAFSYIVNDATTIETFAYMHDLLNRYPSAKFVRIAPDCLSSNSEHLKAFWGAIVSDLDDRFFIKEIGDNDKPFPGGCWVGMLRPYWTSTGIYICTSHVLMERKYLPQYRMYGPEEIIEAWTAANIRFAHGVAPYDIDVKKCGACFYRNNNQILNAVIHELPDKNFA